MASVGFRWLDILEKEFDKAFVDLDLAIGELESDEPDVVFNVRQKLCTLSSCFAQLTHKSQTIFQNSAKIEAELIHMRTELVESKAKREVLEQELHNLLLQLHSSQLSHLPDSLRNRKIDANFKPDVNNIKKKLEAELRQSPIRNIIGRNHHDELNISPTFVEMAQIRAENAQLQAENTTLRNSLLSLNGEVYGAKLAAKYLDKELAGRIQQLQLLGNAKAVSKINITPLVTGREMRGDIRDKLWRQLESEILLQRHKTVVRACRRNSTVNSTEKCPKPEIECGVDEKTEHFGDIRMVVVKRKHGQGLGISITGGREHGVPILISELETNGPAALSEQLYIGDAILSVNDRDLRQACHRQAVEILQQQTGDCTLQVQYIAADDSDTSLEEDGYNFRFFDGEVCETPNDQLNPLHSLDLIQTPTAPRTPELSSTASRIVSRNSPDNVTKTRKLLVVDKRNAVYNKIYDYNSNNGKLDMDITTTTEKTKDDDNKSNNNPTKSLILYDNATSNVIKLENFKKSDAIEDDLNCSTTSLTSENFSSPMQTSTDVFADSEILSTDSQSPKNIQSEIIKKKPHHHHHKQQLQPLYTSNESLSNQKSDQSLLNSEESCGSSPVRKVNRDYKKIQRKYHKKKYFGVKTLQSIFNGKHDGYSDVSSTASEIGDLAASDDHNKILEEDEKKQGAVLMSPPRSPEIKSKSSPTLCGENTSPQFEENIHNILSDIFVKNFGLNDTNCSNNGGATSLLSKATGTKKYFSLHGQHLRVGKALRLCPNEDLYSEQVENEQRKEKLLARYVYNANTINGDGVGDPDFGTPV